MREADPDDDALARAASEGDRVALETLLARHVDRVHALCRRVLANHDDALDATQEALIAVARGIDRFDGRSRFTTWLYRVATNAALDEARRRTRRPHLVEDLPEPVDPACDPADVAGDRLDVDTALAALPDEFRVAVVLRDVCDLEYAEIAEVLGTAPGTVRSRISRGRARLADLLGNRRRASDRPTERT